MSRSRNNPEYDASDLKAELCRYIDAADRGGFDGNEHPEKMKAVNAMFEALYPLEPSHVAMLVTGRASIRV